MKKIIHLSDLHLGYENDTFNFNQIVSAIISQNQPATDYIILITGDLVDNAAIDDQRQVAINTINLLKENKFTVLVIPGNHDYGSGSCANPKYVPIFKETYYGSTQITYPKVDVIADVVFIGIDSTADEMHWYDKFLAEGEIGKEQLGRLKQIVNDSQYAQKKKVVYMHHHPIHTPFFLRLKDSYKLKKIIENKVEALLFGHLHGKTKSTSRIYNGRWGIKRMYNAGSATHKNGNLGYHRIIDLEKDPSSDIDAKYI